MLTKTSINDLKYPIIWSHFKEINAIPRASNNEEAIRNYLVSFGNALGLSTSIDSIGNVIIRKSGTRGKEDCKPIVLQAHLDMVHVKEPTSDFNFEIQGIDMYVDGDWIKAKETTLGADNGIGVAAIMAVLSSTDLTHPPLEGLFTVDEELGMTGAMALTKHQLKGNYLLNLDSEEDDVLTIGCAGGTDVEIMGTYPTQEVNSHDYICHQIHIKNLNGGHSGVDIHKGTANAIVVLVELIDTLIATTKCRLQSFHVEALTNVIPSDGTVSLAVHKNKQTLFATTLREGIERVKRKFQPTDPNLTIWSTQKKGATTAMDGEFQQHYLMRLLKIPNGVFTMSESIPDLVQTSNNIATLTIEKGEYAIKCHVRSSIDSERDALVAQIGDVFPTANFHSLNSYPGWTPKVDSRITAIAIDCYKELNTIAPDIKSIHAGLECGIISGVYPQMEMISFGPNIR